MSIEKKWDGWTGGYQNPDKAKDILNQGDTIDKGTEM